MRSTLRPVPALVTLLLALAVTPARGSFHFMQIEQAIGGVCGDTTQQAVQLRMRAAGQNVVSQARLRVHDAAGANPVLLHDMATDVGASTLGSRVLLATAAFAAAQGITPDFVLTNPIPGGYLPAGRITFEDDAGTIYWSLAFGGAGYTGATTGSATNDPGGDFGPPFAGALPSSLRQALRFQGAATATSSTNAADYALTTGNALFTANTGVSVSVDTLCAIFADGFESGDDSAWVSVP